MSLAKKGVNARKQAYYNLAVFSDVLLVVPEE